jgi:hypothetical protein
MDAITVDTKPKNTASTMDDATAAGFNTLPRNMDAHNTTRKRHSGAATDAASSSKKVTTVEVNAVQGVHYG